MQKVNSLASKPMSKVMIRQDIMSITATSLENHFMNQPPNRVYLQLERMIRMLKQL
ncbi:hypothetical protein D3C80_1857420 [compost metagenome]